MPAPLGGDAPQPEDAAAVVLLFDARHDELPLLFMRRSRLVRTHRGQIAFPGGGVEPGDASVLDAGLRELHEEMGIAREDVEPLGELAPVLTATAFRQVTPIVALQKRDVEPVPDPYEVADWFRIPLAELLRAPLTARRIAGDPMAREVYFYEAGDRVIWGASAAILHDLLARLGRQD
ncbi:MAG TPA: CoA pyrophosphatase [Candidatus Dormibacteraeota bacterium]|nr:CoA pyrophosphatase [Candidatus Dormibacteraeota bacterium]